jgi:hypothetical protein
VCPLMIAFEGACASGLVEVLVKVCAKKLNLSDGESSDTAAREEHLMKNLGRKDGKASGGRGLRAITCYDATCVDLLSEPP